MDGKDFIVDVSVTLSVRVENVADAGMAESIAFDYMDKEPITGESMWKLIADAIEPTAFFIGDAPLAFVAGEAESDDAEGNTLPPLPEDFDPYEAQRKGY